MRTIFAGLALALTVTSGIAGTATLPALPAGVVAPKFFDAAGIKVTAYSRGPGGLNIWTVERNATKTVMYTTPDNKVIMSGVLWDASTGANLSDEFITPDLAIQAPAAAAAVATPPVAEVKGAPGKVTESIAGISKLTGIKEGKGAIDKTVYVMFDPRCPYCKALYAATRQYVRQGATIKWIPVTVLGRDAQGINMVADVLQDPTPVVGLARVEAGGHRPPAAIAPATIKAVKENEEYFYAAFQRNPMIGQAGVPVAFFQDKGGKPQMVMNLDDPLLLNSIFKDVAP